MDPFQILGIDYSASAKEIKDRHRELVRENHPDRGGRLEKFQEIQEAYDALTGDDLVVTATKVNLENLFSTLFSKPRQIRVSTPKIVFTENRSIKVEVDAHTLQVYLPEGTVKGDIVYVETADVYLELV